MVVPPPAARADLVFRPLADEWVILDPVGRRLHVMNLTAALIWGHIDGSRSSSELVEVVWNAFGQFPDRLRVANEVEEVLSDFARRGLLEERGTIQ